MDALAVSLDRQARGSDGNDGGDENGGGGMGEGQTAGRRVWRDDGSDGRMRLTAIK